MRKRDWALIALVYLALAEVLSWTPVPDLSLCLIKPEHTQATHDNGNKYCPAFHTGITASLNALDGFLERHDKSVVGGFTIVLAISTIGLWLATIGLYQAGERQLAHVRTESEAAEVHRTAQFEQIARQIEALQMSAEAAEEQAFQTRELVWDSHLNAQRQLRAYIDIKSAKIENFEIGEEPEVNIRLQNVGQTPAKNVRTRMDAQVAPFNDPLGPFELTGDSEGSRSTIGKDGDITMFLYMEPLTKQLYDAVRYGESVVWVVGLVRYDDIFDNPHYFRFRMFHHGESIEAGIENFTIHDDGNDSD